MCAREQFFVVVIWPTGHLLQKQNDEMHVGEQHICAHCDFDVCAFSAICEFITANKNENVTLVRKKSVVMA